jgi:hypothetical protein
MTIARQRLSKHIPAANNMHATIKEPISKQQIAKYTTVTVLLETAFSLRTVQSGYEEELI